MGSSEGRILFDAGFPIGARASLLAHDFALQSRVCYTLVPADAEKGMRANAASSCSVAEGCADGHSC